MIDYYQHVDQGVELFELGQYPHALRAFWNAFRLVPDSPVLLFNIARTLEHMPKTMWFPQAEDFYEAARTQGSVDALYQLALLHLEAGRRKEAQEFSALYLRETKEEDEYTEYARSIAHHGFHLIKPKNIVVKSEEKVV